MPSFQKRHTDGINSLYEGSRTLAERTHSMSAENVGRWISSEVRNSNEFTAEEVPVGSGNKKRKMWRIGRKGNS